MPALPLEYFIGRHTDTVFHYRGRRKLLHGYWFHTGCSRLSRTLDIAQYRAALRAPIRAPGLSTHSLYSQFTSGRLCLSAK
jgi:hypothetical protein